MPPPMRDHRVTDQYKIPAPKNLKQVPSYIKKVCAAFTSRLVYITKLVWEASPAVLFVMSFMALFNGIIPVIGALIGKELLNELAGAYEGRITTFTVILTLLVIQFAYMFITGIVTRISSMISRISGEIVSNHIKMKIMAKAKDVDISSYDSPEFYAKMENANREAGSRPITVLSSAFNIISSVISIISYIAVLFAVSPLAPLFMIIISIPSTVINFIFRKKNVNYMFHRSKERRQMAYYSDVIVNKDLAKEVRIFGLADTFCEKYSEVFKKYFSGLKKLILSEFWWSMGASVITTVVNCVLFVFIARGVFEQSYEIGNYSLYTGALNAVSTGIASIITTTASIYEGTLFINNMIAFMNEKKHIAPIREPARSVMRHTGHTIVFENVSFRYPGTQRDVLRNISLTINAGDTVVIVGLNGAGKTTLVKLLTRLYDPTGGRILLDGHDLREYDVEQLYEMFGIIFQDFGKYAVSVRENISFGDISRSIDDESIRCAAKKSNSSDYIERLPAGYDTPLMRYFEEDGTELSIGQWQKLAIARAFYSDSDVLILDEPTASLDPMAEQEIFNQFDALRHDKTTIFVSHRLSSATEANKIVVIENGEILEVGNHSQLMNTHGRYYELFSTQARRYNAPVDGDDTHPEYSAPHHTPPV